MAQIRDVISRFEAMMNAERLNNSLTIVDKQVGTDFKIINYLQKETGTDMEVHVSTVTNRVELAVVHLFGYGRGIDLV